MEELDRTLKKLSFVRRGMFVPRRLTEEMIEKVSCPTDAALLVLFSYEMIPILTEMGYTNLYLYVDNVKPHVRGLCNKYGVKLVETFEDINMKFHVVLGNPPFQGVDESGTRKDQASNLWSEFWYTCLTMADKVALVTPTSWLSPSADNKSKERLWDLFDRYDSYANVVDVKKHFSGVGSTFGYVCVDKTSSGGLRFSDGSSTELGFLPNSNLEEVQQVLSLDAEDSLAKFKSDQSNRPKPRVAIPLTRKVSEESVQVIMGESEPIGAKPGLFCYVYSEDEGDLNRIRNSVLAAEDAINYYCRWSGFANLKIIKMIKLEESC